MLKYTQITKLSYVLKKPYTHVENIAGHFAFPWCEKNLISTR